jgi:hypothetical protein
MPDDRLSLTPAQKKAIDPADQLLAHSTAPVVFGGCGISGLSRQMGTSRYHG